MNEEVDNLRKFGNEFQAKCIASLVVDQFFVERIFDILTPDYFESDANKWLVQTTMDYFLKYKSGFNLLCQNPEVFLNLLHLNHFTIPAKPIKAMARSPAVIRAVGIPSIFLGSFTMLSCSRMPAKRMIASPKPMAVDMAKTTLSTRLKSFLTTSSATPKITQLVVMTGRLTPNA